MLCTDGGTCVRSAAEEVKVRRGRGVAAGVRRRGDACGLDDRAAQVFAAADGLG